MPFDTIIIYFQKWKKKHKIESKGAIKANEITDNLNKKIKKGKDFIEIRIN